MYSDGKYPIYATVYHQTLEWAKQTVINNEQKARDNLHCLQEEEWRYFLSSVDGITTWWNDQLVVGKQVVDRPHLERLERQNRKWTQFREAKNRKYLMQRFQLACQRSVRIALWDINEQELLARDDISEQQLMELEGIQQRWSLAVLGRYPPSSSPLPPESLVADLIEWLPVTSPSAEKFNRLVSKTTTPPSKKKRPSPLEIHSRKSVLALSDTPTNLKPDEDIPNDGVPSLPRRRRFHLHMTKAARLSTVSELHQHIHSSTNLTPEEFEQCVEDIVTNERELRRVIRTQYQEGLRDVLADVAAVLWPKNRTILRRPTLYTQEEINIPASQSLKILADNDTALRRRRSTLLERYYTTLSPTDPKNHSMMAKSMRNLKAAETSLSDSGQQGGAPPNNTPPMDLTIPVVPATPSAVDVNYSRETAGIGSLNNVYGTHRAGSLSVDYPNLSNISLHVTSFTSSNNDRESHNNSNSSIFNVDNITHNNNNMDYLGLRTTSPTHSKHQRPSINDMPVNSPGGGYQIPAYFSGKQRRGSVWSHRGRADSVVVPFDGFFEESTFSTNNYCPKATSGRTSIDLDDTDYEYNPAFHIPPSNVADRSESGLQDHQSVGSMEDYSVTSNKSSENAALPPQFRRIERKIKHKVTYDTHWSKAAQTRQQKLLLHPKTAELQASLEMGRNDLSQQNMPADLDNLYTHPPADADEKSRTTAVCNNLLQVLQYNDLKSQEWAEMCEKRKKNQKGKALHSPVLRKRRLVTQQKLFTHS